MAPPVLHGLPATQSPLPADGAARVSFSLYRTAPLPAGARGGRPATSHSRLNQHAFINTLWNTGTRLNEAQA